jgi:hypothetical protein
MLRVQLGKTLKGFPDLQILKTVEVKYFEVPVNGNPRNVSLDG